MTQEAGTPATVDANLSMTQLAGVVSRYFPPEARATAVAIAWHESRGNARALNDKNNTPAGSRDRGLWQINDHWNPDVTDACAFDPECATAWAAGEYKARGWKAWATFKRGAYRPFLEQAEAAVEQADKAPGSAGVKIPGWIPTPTPGEFVEDVKGAADLVIPDAVVDAFKFIGNAFGFVGKGAQILVSPDFWKRMGIAGAGLSLIVIAIVIVKRDTIMVGGATAAGGPAAGAAAQAQVSAKNRRKQQLTSFTDAGAEASAMAAAECVPAAAAARK
jgi:hypothetical protein